VAEPIDRATYKATIAVFEDVMMLLHPFMPFLTEELWSHLNERKGPKDALIIAPWPKSGGGDAKLEAEVQHAFDLVTAVRNTRNERGMRPKEAIALQVKKRTPLGEATTALVSKLANVTAINAVAAPSQGFVTFLVGTTEYAIDLGGSMDAEAEVKKAEEELGYLRGFDRRAQETLERALCFRSAATGLGERAQ